MNDIVRQRLRELVKNHGERFYLDGRLCRSLLADSCAGSRTEMKVLVAAVEEGVTSSLLESAKTAPPLIVIASLVRHLRTERGLTAEAASWAVWSWAWAMGIVDELTFNNGVSIASQKRLQPALHQTSIPTITILSPRGGEKWISGQGYNVEWTYFGPPSRFKIELLRRGKVDNCIAHEYPAKTAHDVVFLRRWEIPKFLPPGSNFRIRISSIEVESCQASSKADFTVWSELSRLYLEIFHQYPCAICRRFYT